MLSSPSAQFLEYERLSAVLEGPHWTRCLVRAERVNWSRRESERLGDCDYGCVSE